LTRKIFFKLLGLFFLLVAVQAVTDAVLHRFAVRHAVSWTAFITFLLAIPIALWAAFRVSTRLQRVVSFARRISEGDLEARLGQAATDELHPIETALNQTAEQLGKSFAESESRRQELATMLDSMQEAVVAITPEGFVRWSNAVMQRMAGTQIRVGRPLVHSARDPELLSCVKGALENREVRTGQARSLAPGRIFEVNAAPLPSGGAIAVLHDVTQIEAAEKSRREFIANVSHELRTPLTSIQGYVETLLEDPACNPDTNRDFLGVIQKNATRMGRLTEDLLALATVESPDYRLARQPIRSSALVRDAMESLGGLVVDSGVELEFYGAPDVTVLADADAMNQVFGNLIENALKYGKSGKRIRVGAKVIDDAVEFCVQDFGPGVAYEHLDRIFERFYRVDKARSRESGGTGLGLAIVKHIVQAHGGIVRAESELGAGATFYFTLPLAAGASNAA
jgi:two-component system, OmpR family, phosphate regulon sensor histidine kinase PhoR